MAKLYSQLVILRLFSSDLIKGILNRRYPIYIAKMQLKKRIGQKETFNEKLAYKMFYDDDPRLKVVCDKLAVRHFVKKTVGEKYLSRILFESDSTDSIPWDSLPKSFVIKVNHGSGGVILVCGCGSKHDILPYFIFGNIWPKFLVDRNEINDTNNISRILDHWLAHSYYHTPNKLPEKSYKNISARILIEEFLSDGSHAVPSDFKFFCFQGRCKVIQVDTDRFQNHSRSMFDRNWNLLPFDYTYPRSEVIPDRPLQLEEMLSIAETLSANFDFIRVDLYNLSGRIVFGELTNYPEGGLGKFIPSQWDAILGTYWD